MFSIEPNVKRQQWKQCSITEYANQIMSKAHTIANYVECMYFLCALAEERNSIGVRTALDSCTHLLRVLLDDVYVVTFSLFFSQT